MPTYVFLVSLTEKGKSHLDEVRQSGKELSKLVAELGGTTKGAFMTFGRYDIIEIIEFPNDISALKFSMKSSESGFADVETLKGFSEKETEFSIL